MNNNAIFVTLLSALLSGMIGVFVSYWFFSRLERRKMKIATARKMFGSRHDIAGKDFQESINEVMVVFSDSQEVIDSLQNLWQVLEIPQHTRSSKSADEAMISLMKTICTDIGIKYKKLPDSYYLKFFSMPRENI